MYCLLCSFGTPFKKCSCLEVLCVVCSYLLSDGVKVRTSDPAYLARVEKYFGHLLPLVAPLQVVHGGPIIMFQVASLLT